MFTAVPQAKPIVHEFVRRLNAIVFTSASMRPAAGAGTARRKAREAAKAKANKAIPSGARMTRQQERAHLRRRVKETYRVLGV